MNEMKAGDLVRLINDPARTGIIQPFPPCSTRAGLRYCVEWNETYYLYSQDNSGRRGRQTWVLTSQIEKVEKVEE